MCFERILVSFLTLWHVWSSVYGWWAIIRGHGRLFIAVGLVLWFKKKKKKRPKFISNCFHSISLYSIPQIGKVHCSPYLLPCSLIAGVLSSLSCEDIFIHGQLLKIIFL